MVSAISIELQIRPRQLDIEECDIQNTKEYTFQLRPTIPIRFNTVPTKDTITLSFGARDDDSGDYLPSECKISLSHSDVNKWKNVSVQVKCDNIDKPAKKAAFTFSVADTHVFWADYTLPSVVVGLSSIPFYPKSPQADSKWLIFVSYMARSLFLACIYPWIFVPEHYLYRKSHDFGCNLE